MQESNGHNVRLLDMPEINQTVDLAGLTVPQKHSMIDYVLKPMEHLILHYQLRIQQHVADSSNVFQWGVMEVKLEHLGVGLKITESLQEEIFKIKILVIHIPCQNVVIMITQLIIQNVQLLNKFHLHVILNVLVIMLFTTPTNIKELLLTH